MPPHGVPPPKNDHPLSIEKWSPLLRNNSWEKFKYRKLLLISMFYFFRLLFGCAMANSVPLFRGQPHSSMLITVWLSIFYLKITESYLMSPFLGASMLPSMYWLRLPNQNFEEPYFPLGRGVEVGAEVGEWHSHSLC